MSVTDFVFGGKSPPNSPATGGNTNVPQWMSDFQMEMVNKANILANDPYHAYPGPRVAPATDAQQGAWKQIQANQGKYAPQFTGALNTAAGTMGNVNPYFSSAASNLGGSTGTFTGDTVGQYMNPYEDQVIQRGADLATRNFNENILPGLNSMFVGSGQFGSTPNAAVAFRGARDVTQNIQDTAGSQLAGAYDAGQGAFQADKSRQLNAGQAYGQLGSSYGNLALNAATTRGNLATAAQNSGYQDTSQLDASGQEQRGITQQSLDQGYQDFINQRDYPWTQIGRAQQVAQGTGPTSTDWSYTGPSKVYGASPAAVGAAGAAANQGINEMYQPQPVAKGGLMRAIKGGIPTGHSAIEAYQSVSDHGGNFARTANHKFSAQELRDHLGDNLEEAGVHRDNARLFNFGEPEFLEFDSTNPGHAVGYWHVPIHGPKPITDRLEAFGEDSDGNLWDDMPPIGPPPAAPVLKPVKKARGGLTRILASNDIPAWLREAIQIDIQEHRRRGH